jgi:hypothetical protein
VAQRLDLILRSERSERLEGRPIVGQGRHLTLARRFGRYVHRQDYGMHTTTSDTQKFVAPAKAGAQESSRFPSFALGPRFRGDDEQGAE